ncbi:MAG: GIY-YIG nuclease family protein [Deltaproteobacteria bacterium]|nr:GIY-YIG nuclease family protein [Deltaproteobacteria bacterium]
MVLRLPNRTRIAIGKLGRFELRPGYYCYVGSGFGPGGVLSRLAHHFRPVEHPHWHVDHLRKVALVEEAWYAVHERKHEHRWAAILGRMPGASIAIPRFGSSDCSCPGHLLSFRTRPAPGEFARPLRARLVGQCGFR